MKNRKNRMFSLNFISSTFHCPILSLSIWICFTLFWIFQFELQKIFTENEWNFPLVLFSTLPTIALHIENWNIYRKGNPISWKIHQILFTYRRGVGEWKKNLSWVTESGNGETFHVSHRISMQNIKEFDSVNWMNE